MGWTELLQLPDALGLTSDCFWKTFASLPARSCLSSHRTSSSLPAALAMAPQAAVHAEQQQQQRGLPKCQSEPVTPGPQWLQSQLPPGAGG